MNDVDEFFKRATSLLQQGRAAEACAAYEKLLRAAPGHGLAWRLRGLAAMQTGQAELARACLVRALALDPAEAEALHFLGGALRRGVAAVAADIAAATAYGRAVAVRPFFPECHFNRGNALSHAGRLPEAAAAYRAAAAQAPLQAVYRLNHAGALLRLGAAAPAAATARGGATLAPGDAKMLAMLARAAAAAGDAAAAERAAGRACRLEPGETAALAHALALSKTGATAAAAEKLRVLSVSADDEVRRGARLGLYNLTVAMTDGGDAPAAARAVMTSADGAAFSPTRVRIESSSACNLRCRHCTTGVDYNGSDRRLMRRELFDRVAQELKGMDAVVSCVMYLGGEPLMNPHLAAMIRRLRDETAVDQIHFVTNAMLATEERCRELADSGVSKIFISIDGRTPEENDAIRRGSHYPTVREHVRLLRRYLEPAGVQLAISNNILRRDGDGDAAATPAFLSADFPGMQVVTAYAYKWPGWRSNDDEAAVAVAVNSARRTGFCDAPFHEAVVRANGDVTMCCYDISGLAVMGNIVETPLASIWNGERYRAVRRAMLAGDEAALPAVCRRCPIYTGEELRRID